jgi:acyl-CoA synthetase (AMP-forming)/AMP-acid ligase II
MNLPDLLAHQARKFPEKEAIVTPTDRISYADWHITVNKLADSLQKLGIEKGDKVVLHMPNTKEFMYTYFAVQRLGALIVPINAKLVQNEVTYILDHSDAKMFVTHEMLFEGVRNLEKADDLNLVKTGEAIDGWLSLEDLIAEGSSNEIACDLTEDDEASILYTSGTTGDPKGVVFTYRSILTVAGMICIEMEMKPESKVLHMMPLSHSAPLHLFMGAGIYVGATHVLVPTFTPDLLLDTVEREKITHFFGAPIAYLASARHPKIEAFDLSSMKYWVYGGAPLSTQEVELVKKQFATDRLMCVYGLTEAGPSGTLLAFGEHDTKAGSIGQRGALHCEIRIVDEKGQDVSQGEVGEIILRGEGNMKGYYKDAEKTAETLRGNWLYTGDMAMQDEDGFYWVVDRKKDIIISGGVNIYPKEIEDQLLTHPQIQDVAVVGVPNPDWGETAKAFVVTDGELENLETVCQEFLQDKVASFKIPKLYEALEALPRNTTGKLLKNQLREQLKS